MWRAAFRPKVAAFFPFNPQYFSFMKQDTHTNYRQRENSPPHNAAKGPSEMDIWNLWGTSTITTKKCLCPFTLYLYLWSWAKAYVLNNKSVRKHMLNNSLQPNSDQKQSKPFHAIPRHKGSRLPLHLADFVQLVSIWRGPMSVSTFQKQKQSVININMAYIPTVSN